MVFPSDLHHFRRETVIIFLLKVRNNFSHVAYKIFLLLLVFRSLTVYVLAHIYLCLFCVHFLFSLFSLCCLNGVVTIISLSTSWILSSAYTILPLGHPLSCSLWCFYLSLLKFPYFSFFIFCIAFLMFSIISYVSSMFAIVPGCIFIMVALKSF